MKQYTATHGGGISGSSGRGAGLSDEEKKKIIKEALEKKREEIAKKKAEAQAALRAKLAAAGQPDTGAEAEIADPEEDMGDDDQ